MTALTHVLTHNTAQPETEIHSGQNAGSKHKQRWSKQAFRNFLKAQYAFKTQYARGILQFKMLITFRCALHHSLSQDIHCWKLKKYTWKIFPPCTRGVYSSGKNKNQVHIAKHSRAKLSFLSPQATQPHTHAHCKPACERIQMFLPQVHLRKPCYDFSFL